MRRRLGSLLVAVLPLVWLLVVLVPIYYMVVTAIRPARDYLTGNPWVPSSLTLENFVQVVDSGFGVFLRNSVVVTTGAVACQLVVSMLAAYGLARRTNGLASRALALLLLGLAIPVQAAVIPLFLVITRLGLYDTLAAVILPLVAFNIPISILILLTYLRDIPTELYDAMEADGAGPFRILWRLVVPLSMPALVTVAIFNALAAWNGFLFPLILTQSPEVRVVPVGLYAFKNDHATAVPAMLAAVLLSAMPLLIAYVVGRRQMLRGLAALGA